MRKIGLMLIPLLMLILFNGCVKIDVGLTMDGSESGTFEEQLVVVKGSLDTNLVEENLAQLNTEGVNIEDVTLTEDGTTYEGKKISFKFNSYKDLQKKLITLFSGAKDNVENTNDNVNKIAGYVKYEDGNIILDMPAETFISGMVGNNKYSYGIDAVFFMEMNDIEVKSQNADKVDGTRYEWNLMDRTSNIQIVYEQGLSWFSALVILLVISILALAIVLMLVDVNEKRGKPKKTKEEPEGTKEDTEEAEERAEKTETTE